MSKRKMHFVAFLLAGPTAHHHGAWRHPEADLGVFTPQWHEHIARVLEAGKFDSLFFADILGLYDLYRRQLRHDPASWRTDGAVRSHSVAVDHGACHQPHRVWEPHYHLRSMPRIIWRGHSARSICMSGGRVAWNVVASHGHLEAQNFGFAELPARDVRYDYADEVVEAVCKLWESWDADALVFDKQRGIYADPDKVHYVNYQGKWIKTRGPLTVPRSPQGRPVIMQAGSSPRGRDFAATLGRAGVHLAAQQGGHAGVLHRSESACGRARSRAGGMPDPAVNRRYRRRDRCDRARAGGLCERPRADGSGVWRKCPAISASIFRSILLISRSTTCRWKRGRVARWM